MSNNFALMLRIKGDVSVDQLNAALRRIRVRHPALFLDPSDSAQVFPLAVRTGCGDDDWNAAAQAELREPFADRPGPFARFVMLQREGQAFDLLAAFHHGKCDGISGVFVLRDLLKALADPQATLVALPAPPPTGRLLPATALANRSLQFRVALAVAGLRAQILLQKLRRRLVPRKPAGTTVAAQPSSPTAELPLSEQYVILPTRLTAAQTAALTARCKQEQVSVHAALCTAWLMARTNVSISPLGNVSSPVNLRERLTPPPGETSGLFLALVETRLECDPGRDFWDLAREFKANMAGSMRDEQLFFKPLLFSALFTRFAPADLGMLVGILFNGPVAYDYSITNLGRLPIPERSGGLRMEAFYGPLVNSTEYERTVGISTLGGQMSITYLFRKSQTDPAEGRQVMERALELLTQAAG